VKSRIWLSIFALSLLLAVACERPESSRTKKGSDGASTTETGPTATADATDTPTTANMSAIIDCEYKPPMTKGKPCGEPSGERVPGQCDPVAQTGCPEGKHCRFAVKMDENGQPDSFFRVCSDMVCGSRTKLPGESCEPNQCMPGSLCVSSVCKRYCRRSDGAGCAPDEFCVEAALNPEFGYCESTCSL
jgi:hypothetical protein